MTGAVAFDALAYARRLRAAGVEDAQAEAHAGAMRKAVTDGVATKADIAGLKAGTLKVAIGVVVAQTALITGLIFGLLKLFGGV